jgi:DNA processing protein
MTDELLSWVALNLVPGVGSVLFKRLLERFHTPDAVFRASSRELLSVEGVGEKVAGEIRKGVPEEKAEKEIRLLKEAGGTFLTLRDDRYPWRLKEIYDPPPVLYLRGKLKPEDSLAVAIVGSRKTSPYGRWITDKISREMSEQGVTIVSGMARGVDSIAHWGSLSKGGRTIAVLGCGVDVIYPPENRPLLTKIVEHGAVLSEFPMGAPPEGIHFPRRNRIISGLSIGVVVVQAGAKSGSLITADYALDQGREVFAIPGNVGADGSRGTHRLIKEGAKLVESSEDILETILPQWKKESQTPADPFLPERELSNEEKAVYHLMGDMPLHIDGVIRESRLDPGKVSSVLLNLELKGLIVQWPGKCFTKKNL